MINAYELCTSFWQFLVPDFKHLSASGDIVIEKQTMSSNTYDSSENDVYLMQPKLYVCLMELWCVRVSQYVCVCSVRDLSN